MVIQKDELIEKLEAAIKDDVSAKIVKLAPGEVMLGSFVGLDKQHNILIDFPGNETNQPVIATTTIKLTPSQIGSQVALMFVNGSLKQPLVMGVIYNPLNEVLENEIETSLVNGADKKVADSTKIEDVKVDGKRVVLEGKEEIVLKCGEASITLTKEGKISIRGKYLLNRSTGVNRILGGSVQVN